MTTSRTRLAVIRITVLGTVAVVAVGCSSGSNSDRPGDAARHAGFLAAVEKVCSRAVAAHAGHSFPLPGFDPDHPRPDQLPAVGDYFARWGRLPQTTAALHRLVPPSADATQWRQLLSVADEMRDNALRQIAAARAKDVGTFVTTVHAANELIDEVNREGADFGFSATSPCGQVFG